MTGDGYLVGIITSAFPIFPSARETRVSGEEWERCWSHFLGISLTRLASALSETPVGITQSCSIFLFFSDENLNQWKAKEPIQGQAAKCQLPIHNPGYF